MVVMSFPGLERAWLYRLFIMILILQIAAGKRKIGQSSISSAVGRAETVGQAAIAVGSALAGVTKVNCGHTFHSMKYGTTSATKKLLS